MEPAAMETPLLLGDSSGTVARALSNVDKEEGELEVLEDYAEVSGLGDAKKVFVKELRNLWVIAAPITFNILCLYGINSFTQIFVGHLGNLQLSAVAVGLSVISNFSFGFLLGMGSALETLCGQAFGAGQVHMLGIYIQRSWIVLFASAVAMAPLFIYATPILKLIGQADDMAELAGEFALYLTPHIFALAVNFPAQKFLQAQSKVGILAWVGFLALPVHILLLYLFVFAFGWGLHGAAFAYDITSWGVSLAQVVYIVGWCKEGWTGLSMDAFKDIFAFVRLSLAAAVMICLEIWYPMVLVILAGRLKDAEIAVGSISICMNINGWEAMVFAGINVAVSVRVSNELGRGRPRATKYSVVVAVLVSLVIGIVCMISVLAFSNFFTVIFTSDKEMQQAVGKLAYLLGVTMLLNSVQPTILGVAVGGGWQAPVAYINLGCYYFFGLPFGFLLGYVFHLGVQGIWAGLLCGTLAQTLILVVLILKTNWNKEAVRVSNRLKRWGSQADDEAKKLVV